MIIIAICPGAKEPRVFSCMQHRRNIQEPGLTNLRKEGDRFELGFYHEISAAVPEGGGADGKNRGGRYFVICSGRAYLCGSRVF